MKTGQTRVRMRSIEGGRSTARIDLLATEEPMEIRMRAGSQTRSIAVTMRTPGADFELAAGFLFAEGLIEPRQDIARIEYCLECEDAEQRYNIVTVVVRGKGQRAKGKGGGVGKTASRPDGQNDSDLLPSPAVGRGAGGEGILADLPSGRLADFPVRNFAMTSACGLCGKERLDQIERRGVQPVGPGPTVDWRTITGLPGTLREAQGLFSTTGGLHAAALFTPAGEMIAVREDVGRHNAVDKVIGWALLEDRLPLADAILMVSGRSSFEIAQKAVAAGIPILCAVSAPSSLAVDVAQRFGMTLVGFLRGERFNIYTGPARIQLDPER